MRLRQAKKSNAETAAPDLTSMGMDEKTANQMISTSKALIVFLMIYQFLVIFSLYTGEKMLAEISGDAFHIQDFLTEGTFATVIITSIGMLIYVSTRIIWYTVLLCLLFFIDISLHIVNQSLDGFSTDDLSILLSGKSANMIMLLFSAMSMYAIKNIKKQKQHNG